MPRVELKKDIKKFESASNFHKEIGSLIRKEAVYFVNSSMIHALNILPII